MYIRLWWKDARQFWPIWAFLVLVAGGIQIVMHSLASEATRGGLLVPIALGCAILYAFAVGSAAFAGEREAGTLRLLDLLSAPRVVVWLSKVSFAIVSTVVLGVFLSGLAALDATPHPGAPWELPDGQMMQTLAILMFQALAWGLLCSSILPNALIAAVAAIGLTTTFRLVSAGIWLRSPGAELALDLSVPAVMIVISLIIFAWGHREVRLVGLRLPLTFRFRSPIEVTWRDRPAEAPARPRAMAEVPAPRVAAVASEWSADRPWPRSRFAEFRALFWQAVREGRSTWLVLLALAIPGQAVHLTQWDRMVVRSPLVILPSILIAFVAGISVFGLENRGRTYRFLVHHGARPGLVWLSKFSAWCFGLALLWGPLLYVLVTLPIDVQPQHEAQARGILAFALILPLCFGISVLCGMVIPRGITAGVFAVVISILIGFGAGGLTAMEMVPAWGMLIFPAAFVLMSMAWSRDWMLERPAPGRYLRLVGMLAVVLMASASGFAGWRVWSVPDVGPIPRPATWATAGETIPYERNAAPVYRRADNMMALDRTEDARADRSPPTPGDGAEGAPGDLDRHPKTAALIREAAARPECRFERPDRLHDNRSELSMIANLWQAMAAHARKSLERGQLDAAWDDITASISMGRQFARDADIYQAASALSFERGALEIAREWANAPGQTAARLRAALSSYRGLRSPYPAIEVIRGQGLLEEQKIDLPLDDLIDWIASQGSGRSPTTWELLWLDVAATPWERARARRVNRLLADDAARLAALEPWQRPGGPRAGGIQDELLPRERLTLIGRLNVNYRWFVRAEDRTEADRRGTLQVLAMRAWMLDHEGQYPESLEALVPSELPALPLDPYTGRPFRETTVAEASRRQPEYKWPEPRWPDRTRLIYSIGPDLMDGGGQVAETTLADRGDIVFPVLPSMSVKK